MADIIFKAGETRHFIVGAVTKNWGGPPWAELEQNEKLIRIKQIHEVVNTLLAKDENLKILRAGA